MRNTLILATLAVALMTAAADAIASSEQPAGARSSPAASVHPSLWDALPRRAPDAQVEAAVSALIEHMSLEDKVGQMIQADIAAIRPADLAGIHLGSILAGGNAAPNDDVLSPPAAWLAMAEAFHHAASAPGSARSPILPLLGIDAVHGHAKVIGATLFPHNVGLGAMHDAGLVQRIGAATAEEVAATGFDWTFAPTVAVVRDVRWGRTYESYSEQPALVREYAAALVTGLQGELGTPDFLGPGHTLSSVKHFIGDGGTEDGRDQGNTVISESELARVHAAGYYGALGAGAQIVMASYNSWNGNKVHGHAGLLTEILKGRLGFDGFVVGDWNAHEQLPGCTKSDCPAAINAGIDMLMAPDEWRALYANLLAEARSGVIAPERIDDAVRRILRVKVRAGLTGARPARPALDVLGNAAHRALARSAVRQSLVLLKNEHALLPLDPHARVLIAGDAADDVGIQSGGWTLDWQGTHRARADFPGATSIYSGIRAAVTAAGGSAELAADGAFKRRPDVAIVVFGETPYAEFEGDRENLDFSAGDPRPLSLLRRLRAQGIRTVSVFLSGRPLWVNPELNASDAFVAAWLPGSEGEGVADVLFRAADGTIPHPFTGRLAFSWPDTAMPVRFDTDAPSGVLFAVGYGLGAAGAPDVEARARFSEDPHIAPGHEAPRGLLFADGHPIAPYGLFVADGDAQVHVTSAAQASPHGALEARLGGAGLQARWAGAGPGELRISGRATDLEPQAARGTVLKIHYRLDERPTGPVSLGVHCEGCGAGAHPLDLSPAFGHAAIGKWETLEVPLSCLDPAHRELAHVDSPFVLSSSGEFALTLARIELSAPPAPGHTPCP
jgi:beta-glucosidase